MVSQLRKLKLKVLSRAWKLGLQALSPADVQAEVFFQPGPEPATAQRIISANRKRRREN